MENISHPEVIKRYIENKEADELLVCIETLEPNSVFLGEGKNAEVFGLDEGKFRSVCMKKIRKTPKLKCNDIDTEVDFQNRVRELGVQTPLTFAYVKDKENKEEAILMERVYGITLKEIVYGSKAVPDNYDHRKFFGTLKEYVKKMHENNIHHRDLHEDNVMIDENGNPVIIDFGTACTSFSGDEFPYNEQVLLYDEKTERYQLASGYFRDDERMLYQLELGMRKFAANKAQVDFI